jgi:hypothetical protein
MVPPSERTAIENHLRDLRAAARDLDSYIRNEARATDNRQIGEHEGSEDQGMDKAAEVEGQLQKARSDVDRHGRAVVEYAESNGIDAICIRDLLAGQAPDLEALSAFIDVVYEHVRSTPDYRFDTLLRHAFIAVDLLRGMAGADRPPGAAHGLDDARREKEAEKGFETLDRSIRTARASEVIGHWTHLLAWQHLDTLHRQFTAAIGQSDGWPTVWMRFEQILRHSEAPNMERFEREIRDNLLRLRGEREAPAWRDHLQAIRTVDGAFKNAAPPGDSSSMTEGGLPHVLSSAPGALTSAAKANPLRNQPCSGSKEAESEGQDSPAVEC